MKLFHKFDIDVAKLDLGQHEFTYKIDDEFFELFEYSLLVHGDLKVNLNLLRKTSFIELHYQISGTIELICDRSLDKYDQQISTENKIILKYGEEEEELSDEIEIIAFNTQVINTSRHIYEFITVAIPMKKLHPRYQDEKSDNQMIYSSSESEDDDEGQDMDPRWNDLKKLKK